MAKNSYTTNEFRNSSIDPWFITGLFDAESSFVITILKNPSLGRLALLCTRASRARLDTKQDGTFKLEFK
jgi:hypothetical protein